MKSSLQHILPQQISEEAEEAVLDKLRSKMTAAIRVFVKSMRALEARYGPEVKDVARAALLKREPRTESEIGDPADDLQKFCQAMEKGCAGTHEWVRTVDEPDRIGYRFTRCLWAEIFRELNAADLGFFTCEGDEPAVKAYNPALGFSRTKTLMQGHNECDHVIFAKNRRAKMKT